MRSLTLLILIVRLLFSATWSGAAELTAVEVMKNIQALGPGVVIETLWKSGENYPNDWDRVVEKIATGENDWLEVAKALKPASDAGASEDLNGALAVALVKRPVEVLFLAQMGPFSVKDVCFCPYVDETPDDAVTADTFLADVDRALIGMKIPADNPRLGNVRRNCLERLRGIKRGDYRRGWEERPPPNEWRAVLDRDEEFQALLNSIKTGTEDALKDFRAMQPVTDPMKNGYLERAVALALPSNPLGVLSMVADGYVGIASVCRSPFDERGSSLKHLYGSEGALKRAVFPGGDPILTTIRRNCLVEIRTSLKSFEKNR